MGFLKRLLGPKFTALEWFRTRGEARKILRQLKSAFPKDRWFIQRTNRDPIFPFEIVRIHKGRKSFSGHKRKR